MGVGMCLYAQLVQTKNKQCESAIILQCIYLTSVPDPGYALAMYPPPENCPWRAPLFQYSGAGAGHVILRTTVIPPCSERLD